MQDDGYSLTLAGLLRKRGELHLEVERARAQMTVALAALEHLDATIRVFKPDIDIGDLPERPLPPANAAFRGEVQRSLLDMIRKAGRPMTTLECTEAVMRQRGLDPSDRVLAGLIRKRTGHSLAGLRRKGMLDGHRYGKGPECEWTLTGREGGVSGWRNASG
jgi:hypothetical protein